MSAIAEAPSIRLPAPSRARSTSALLTLAKRRASLTSKTPRQIAVPLLGREGGHCAHNAGVRPTVIRVQLLHLANAHTLSLPR